MNKKINEEKSKKINEQKLKEIGEEIRKGKIAIFPTETVYGIGTNGLNEEGIKKLFDIKKRPKEKPISLLVNSIEMIEKVAKITKEEKMIIEKFFPGPLTLIVEKKEIVPDILTSDKKTVGIRMPDDEIALKLIKYANTPIATSSANISGKENNTNIIDIKKEFKEKVDYYIDGGKSKIGIGSTIVKIENKKPYILRQGTISKEEIMILF